MKSENSTTVHDHHHGPIRNLRVAFFLNLGFTLVEIVGGLWTNSTAIVADALHDLGDTFSLALAWYLQKAAARKPDLLYSFGYRRLSLLGAIGNSLILIGGSIFVLRMAGLRLLKPEAVHSHGMLLLALLGILVNGAAAMKLRRGKTMNERVVSLHLLEDLLGWVAVLIIAFVMLFADIPFLDPLLSLIITSYVLFRVLTNLRRGYRLFLQAVPEGVNIRDIELALASIPGVQAVHDTHIWSLDGDAHVLSVHLVVARGTDLETCAVIKEEARELLRSKKIAHSTIEFETDQENCGMGECFIGDAEKHE